jgi:hypothetical protein
MSRRCLVALLALAGCSDEHSCPAVQEFNGFTLVLDDDVWEAARYSIEVSYSDKAGDHAYRCDVPIPAVDGDRDAGIEGLFECVSLRAGQSFDLPRGRAGKALVLTFDGTPTTAHLVVRDKDMLVVERDLRLDYETSYRFGEHCQGSTTADVRVDLSGG